MKYAVALVLAGMTLHAQSLPIPAGPNPTLSLPAVDNHALSAVVSSSVTPDGQIHNASDLYLLSTGGTVVRQLTSLENYGATWIDLSSDGSKAAYNVTASAPPGKEEIHVVDTTSGVDRKVAVDTVGCVQPLESAICFGCFFTCVRTVHLSPDASKVVYSASEIQPLYVANVDGSGVLHVPIEGAMLAPSPQRVVSRNGLLVFTTSAGVFTVNVDGSAMQNVAKVPTGTYVTNATISEDGGTIAFQALPQVVTGRASSQVYILHLDGSAPGQLAGDADTSSPSISADGSLVAFVQGGQVFIQPADGSSPAVRVTGFRYQAANAVTLSGDGSTALVSLGSAVYTARTGMTAQRLYAPRAILPGGISSYSGLSAPSPGSLIRISGWNFQDDDAASGVGVPLPAVLGGVSVSAGGQAIPLLSVTPSQITAQLPFTTQPGATPFTVSFDGGGEAMASVMVKDATPEVLQYPLQWFSSSYAMAFHAGTATPADQGHPAVAGEALEMYGLGLGTVTPAVDAGVPAPANPPARAGVVPQVKIGNQNATVTFAGLAPGTIGIYQVNVVVPGGLRSGGQPVSWSPGGPGWTIWVK